MLSLSETEDDTTEDDTIVASSGTRGTSFIRWATLILNSYGAPNIVKYDR